MKKNIVEMRKNACPININEADVYQKDRKWYESDSNKYFDYNAGISKCYIWKKADPYVISYQDLGNGYVLITRSTAAYIDKNHTEWEGHLYEYG